MNDIDFKEFVKDMDKESVTDSLFDTAIIYMFLLVALIPLFIVYYVVFNLN